MLRNPDPRGGLLSLTFNQDRSFFACGTPTGFRLFGAENGRETYAREFPGGGIGVVEMMFCTNVLALVGGGLTPNFYPNKVMLWDDDQSSCVGKLDFKAEVKSVRLSRRLLVCVLEKEVWVYDFDKLESVACFETVSNPKGVVALSHASNSAVLAMPMKNVGGVHIEHLDTGKRTFIDEAHESAISQLCLSDSGHILATASEKGTLIRLWDTYEGVAFQEVRRGSEPADIFSISLSPDSAYLACTSARGTMHLFSVSSDAPSGNSSSNSSSSKKVTNRRSVMSFLGGYFKSEWSFAKVNVGDSPAICCFDANPGENVVNVVSLSGVYRKFQFSSNDCREILSYQFLSADED